MLFNVSGLMQDGVGSTRSVVVEGVLDREGKTPETVRGSAELVCLLTGVIVRAHLEIVEPELCSRCLNPLDETIRIDFEEEFHATIDARTGQQLPGPEDQDSFLIDSQHMLDLTEAVRQYREVSTAMQPLCKPDCRGLCPVCGSDLNLGECDCDNSPIDPRWSALAAFRGAAPDRKE